MRPRLLILPPLIVITSFSSVSARTQRPDTELPLPPVRIRLASLGAPAVVSLERSPGLTFTEAGEERILSVEGDPAVIRADGDRVCVGGRRLAVLRVEASYIGLRLGKERRLYPDCLLIRASSGRLSLENECDLEEYATGVLARECPSTFHAEAIRAMAVATRTYSFRRAYQSRIPLCDLVHCQVYRGLGGVPTSIQDAMHSTEGRVALHDGRVIDAVYSSDCGGDTEGNDDAWGGQPVPYLRSVRDGAVGKEQHYCAVSRRHTWTVQVAAARLRALVGSGDETPSVETTERTPTGKVRQIRVRYRTSGGGQAEKLFSGVQWQQLVGDSRVLSLKYTCRMTEGGLEMEGRGWGHGVGLCQHGAQGMARLGATAGRILRHYYTGIEVGPIPELSADSLALIQQRRRDWLASATGLPAAMFSAAIRSGRMQSASRPTRSEVVAPREAREPENRRVAAVRLPSSGREVTEEEARRAMLARAAPQRRDQDRQAAARQMRVTSTRTQRARTQPMRVEAE